MKTKPIIVALATLLIGSLSLWACQNDDIVSGIPDMTEHIALKSGQAETAIFGNVGKMVPFRGSGTWQAVDFSEPDFEKMEIEIDVAFEGTATHLGRFQAEWTATFKFEFLPDENGEHIIDPETGYPVIVPTDYVSHSTIYTAANGDELHDEGSVDNGTEHFLHDDGIGFFMTGIHIVGGTGRFENAVGSYDILVTATVGFPYPGGTWELEGEIRFGKMAPFRGSGTYEFAGIPDFDEDIIDGEEVLVLVAVVKLEGRATRLGRLEGFETWRFRFDPEGPDGMFGDYLSHESTWIAANGDELHNEGSVEHGSVHEFYEPLGTGFSLTGVRIMRGTGRFENAAGWYDFWVTPTSDFGGTWEFEGEISN